MFVVTLEKDGSIIVPEAVMKEMRLIAGDPVMFSICGNGIVMRKSRSK